MPSQVQIKSKVIIAGSEGLIGKALCSSLESEYEVVKIDIELGHDLKNEQVVIELMKKHADETI